MKKRNVVISTLSGDAFEEIMDKLEETKVYIVEKRYDLLYHRYEIFIRANLRQRYIMRNFIKSLDANIIEF